MRTRILLDAPLLRWLDAAARVCGVERAVFIRRACARFGSNDAPRQRSAGAVTRDAAGRILSRAAVMRYAVKVAGLPGVTSAQAACAVRLALYDCDVPQYTVLPQDPALGLDGRRTARGRTRRRRNRARTLRIRMRTALVLRMQEQMERRHSAELTVFVREYVARRHGRIAGEVIDLATDLAVPLPETLRATAAEAVEIYREVISASCPM